MEERLRRRLRDAFDHPDFPPRDLVWRAMERIDEQPEHGHHREWAIALAALLITAAVLATFVVVSQRLVQKPQPAHTPPTTTEPGGAIPPNVSGRRVFLVSPDVGWRISIQGEQGYSPATLSKTTDGGLHWQDQMNWKGGDPMAVRFDDANNGILVFRVAGTPAAVWGTSDGRTWQRGATPVEPAAVYFINSHEGWMKSASGPSVSIYHTTDAGQTWKKVGGFTAPDTSYTAGSLDFSDSSNGYITGLAQGRMPPVYVTHDGGATWAPVQMPAPPVLDSAAAVSVIDMQTAPDRAFAIVEIYSGNRFNLYLVSTADGGRTWASPLPLPESSSGATLQVIDKDRMWLAGAELWNTTDGGRRWTKVPARLPDPPPGYRNPGNHLNGVQFVNQEVGWAYLGQQERCVSQSGEGAPSGWPSCGTQPARHRYIAIKTADGGRTWTVVTPLS